MNLNTIRSIDGRLPQKLELRSIVRGLALRVAADLERTARHRDARSGLVEVAVPDLVEVLTLEDVLRIDRTEERLVRRVRLAEREAHRLRVDLLRLRDRVVAAAARDLVLRVDERLPREDEVVGRDLPAVAPLRLLLDGIRQPERLLRDDRLADHVRLEGEVRPDDVGPGRRDPGRPRRPRVVAACRGPKFRSLGFRTD